MRFIHDRLLPLWIVLALASVAACWLLAPEPTQAKALASVAENWKLPTLADNESRKSTDAIVARNLWGMATPNGVPVVSEPVWSIQGIVRNGTERFVLLAYEGKPVEILKAGDALPDGAKITQIDEDRFFVLTAKKKKLAFGIYKNETAK